MTRHQAARQRRLLRRRRRIVTLLLLLTAVLIITPVACTRKAAAPQTPTAPPASVLPSVTTDSTAAPLSPVPTPEIAPWTEEDVLAIARTLSGECYEDKTQDKRLVAEVIVNRVSAGHFRDTVIDVVTSPYQFVGYWNPSREISENDIQIATETLRDWYANDCNALSEWLYFTAGDNRENNFRTEYEEE